MTYTLLQSASSNATKANAKPQDLSPKELENIDLNFPLILHVCTSLQNIYCRSF